MCVKNIKYTSALPHLWHIKGPHTYWCVWKILNIQVQSHTCDTCRVPTPADVHQKYWIYKFTHASTTHTGPLHLPVCVKNIKSTSTFPHLWPIQGPHICGCVWKILTLQVHSHNVAHTGPPHLQMRIKNIKSTSMSQTCSTYRAGAVCQKYWIYKYTPTPTTHTGPQHLQMCMKNTESTSTLPHL